MTYTPPDRVLGVDFSGAADAGRNVWLAEIDCAAEPRLVNCAPASECFDAPADRESTHRALTHHLASLNDDAAAGLDFPFSLPHSVVSETDWESFLRDFPGLFASPDELQRRCQSRGALADDDRVQYRRKTEREMSALSPYNRRLRSQTFYGIRDVLRPLVLTGAVRVAPMQSLTPDQPTLLETYPAATLDSLDGETHRNGYKEDDEEGRRRREANLDALEAEASLGLTDAVRERLLGDDGGDGIDAALAAFATMRNTADPSNLGIDDPVASAEGYIYV